MNTCLDREIIMASDWSKTPTTWIRYDDLLRKFKVSDIGPSIAGLRLYMTLAMRANFKPTNELSLSGTVRVTYTELEHLTHMSRASVAAGVNKLKNVGLIELLNEGRDNIYHLVDYDDARGWGKLPKKYLYGRTRHGEIEKIAAFSMRSRAHLNALKIYLLFIAFQTGRYGYALLSYDAITKYSGISREFIHPGISVLIDLHLINVDRENAPGVTKKHPNKYIIRGLDA